MIRKFALAIVLALGISPALAAQNTLITPGSPLTMAGLATFLNNAFQSVATNYAGATPPAVCTGGTACTYQYWLDTSTSPRVLRIYDGANWVSIGSLDTSLHAFSPAVSEIPSARSGSTDAIGDADRGALIRYTHATATAASIAQAGTASQFPAGWWTDVRAASTGTVTITPTVSTINGASSLTLPPGLSVRIISDGTNYFTTQTVGTPTTTVLGGAFSKAAIASNWIRSLGTDGIFTTSQPAFTDISGTALATQGGTGLTTYALGDVIYGSAANTLSALPGNIAAVRKFLRQTGTGAVSAAPVWDTILAADIPGSALTKTDDTNVTLTLGGSPTTALLNAASITAGWTGTLAAARLNANVVQGVTNDTNVTGSITAQNLTLGWTGTLAAARLNANVVQGVTNDTNVTGSIAAQNLTLGWTGTLAYARMQNVAASRLLGNPTGSPASPSEITLGATLAFSGTAVQTGAATGDVTWSANSFATTLANIPSATPMAGSLLATNIAAPATPAAGKTSIFVDSTAKRLHDINDAGAIGTTVVGDAGAANNYISAINPATGAITKSRPACATLSDSTPSCSTANASINTASTLVLRDGSGNFAAGTITAALSGNASTATALATARAIYGNNFDGTAPLTQVIASTYGGTGNGFTKFTGPTTAEKSFALPDANATILTTNAAVTVAQGGTGQTTALAARGSSGLNIDSCTSVGDTNGTIVAADRCYYHTALSAARTDTLPAANSVNAGQVFYLTDFRGVATASNTITLQAAGADTINGASSVVAVAAQYGAGIFWSDGSSRWSFMPTGSGGGSGTVTQVSSGTCLTGGPITASGTLSLDDTCRRNEMLVRIYQAKSFGAVRRFLSAAADGFATTGGINTGSSTNYAVTASSLSSMYVAPTTSVTTTGTWASTPSSSNSFGSSGAAGVSAGFQFTAPSTGVIATIKMHATTVSVSGNFTAFLYTNNAGNPGTQIGIASNATNVTATGDITWTFPTPPSVTASTVYWIVISGSGSADVTFDTVANDASYGSGRNNTITSITTTGLTSSNDWHLQISYSATTDNMTLVAASQTADATVSNVRALLDYDDTASITWGTDATLEFSCNGGTNYATATVTKGLGAGQSGHNTAESNDLSCGANTGTSIVYRLKTLTNKNMPIYGISTTWH